MKRPDLTALITIAVLTITAWYAGIWNNRPDTMSHHARDLYSAYLPNLDYAASQLREGHIPWWNPYEFAGMPMIATLEFGPFYPPTLLYALGDTADMHLLSALIHAILFAAFTYALLRIAIRLGAAAATFGAITALLSGWTLSRGLLYPDAFRAGIYIPLILLAVERCITQRTPRWSAILGIAMALQFLAGELEIFVRTALLAAAYTLYLTFTGTLSFRPGFSLPHRSSSPHRSSFLRRQESPPQPATQTTAYEPRPDRLPRTLFSLQAAIPLIYPALGATIALLLIGIQLIPTTHLAQQSLRSTTGLTYEEAVNPIDGGIQNPLELLTKLAVDTGPPYIYYLGPLALIFSLFALHTGNRNGYFFSAIGLLLFLLILGDGTPLYRIYHALPTGDWFRFPLRLQPFIFVCLVVTASIGVNHWLHLATNTKALHRRAQKISVTALGATLLITAITLLTLHYTPALILAALFGAFMIPAGLKLHGPPLRIAAIALLFATTFATGLTARDITPYIPPPNPNLVGFSPEIQQALNEHRDPAERVYIDAAVEAGRRIPKYGLLTRTPCIDGFSPFVSQQFWDFIKPHRADRLIASAAALESEGRDSSLGLWGGLAIKNGAGEALDMLGVRRIAVGPGSELFADDTERNRYRTIQAEDEIEVLENPNAWPRAFTIPADHPFETEADLQNAPRNPATITHYEPGNLTIDLPEQTTGTLILTDEYTEGWQATVDGNPARIDRAAKLFRALPLEPGTTTVEFTYHPPGLRTGLAMTTLGLILTALCLLMPKRLYSRS